MLVPLSRIAVLAVPPDGPGEGQAFGVPADGRQASADEGVVDPDDLLLDDRTLVEVGGHVVRGGADQLDPAVVGLVVRLGALEARAGTSGGC